MRFLRVKDKFPNIPSVTSKMGSHSPSWTTKPHTHIDSNKWYYVGISYDYYSGVAKIWVNGRATSEVRKWRQHVSYLHPKARFRYKSVSVVLLLGIADS